MKKTIVAVTVLLASFGAAATGNSVQQQIDDLRSDLHDVHMNTLQKYSESWGLEDRANIAKLQDTKLDKSVFAVDQARQDNALADSITKQSATDAKQTTDLKSYADKKATSAYETSVAHTDAKVARADADRLKGDTELSNRIESNVSKQSVRDSGQDTHINAVQDAAQSANVKANNLAVRADGTEAALAVTDSRSINNSVRLDGAESSIRETNSQVEYNASYAQSRLDAADAHNEANRVAQVNTNKRVAAHTAQLQNHEQRLGNLEQSTNRSFADMGKRIDRVQDKANAGVSAALSSAAIPQVTEYQRFALGAGVGGYEGEQALAVGFSSRVSSAVVIKASVTTDSQSGFGYNAGVSVGW